MRRVLALVGLTLALAAGLTLTPSPRDAASDEARAALGPLLDALSPVSSAHARVGGQPPPFALPAAVGGPTSAQFRTVQI
jgi:hypothetical protein